MTVLSDATLREIKPIDPFEERTKAFGMTYGLGPAGYDIRSDQSITIPPGGFKLVSSMEQFDMPADVIAFVHDKSTWARLGLAVQNTVIEPGWRGYLTMELTNHSHNTINIERGMPLAQVIFHQLDQPTTQKYAGKYQDQPAKPVQAIIEMDS